MLRNPVPGVARFIDPPDGHDFRGNSSLKLRTTLRLASGRESLELRASTTPT
jgi:hypothetical protein